MLERPSKGPAKETFRRKNQKFYEFFFRNMWKKKELHDQDVFLQVPGGAYSGGRSAQTFTSVKVATLLCYK